MVGAKLRIFPRGGGIWQDKSSATQWRIPLISTSDNWVSSNCRNFFMILVWDSSVSSCSLCSLRFCRAQPFKQRLQKQPCNKFGLKSHEKISQKAAKKHSRTDRSSRYSWIGKSSKSRRRLHGCGFCVFYIRPPLSFEFKTMLRIFPFPGIDISVIYSPDAPRLPTSGAS